MNIPFPHDVKEVPASKNTSTHPSEIPQRIAFYVMPLYACVYKTLFMMDWVNKN